jgi:hypothetical protein
MSRHPRPLSRSRSAAVFLEIPELSMHQVLCTLSNEGSDVRCTVCGQGFLVYWSRFSREEQAECRRLIQEELRAHHVAARDADADRRTHPRQPFTVPPWDGPADYSAAALLGNGQSIGEEMS